MIPDYIISDDENFATYLDEISVTSKAMRIGAHREQEARQLYTDLTGLHIAETGCIQHPTIRGFASSPDGIAREHEQSDTTGTGTLGTLEIKCPKPSTYIEYAANVRTPEDLRAFNPRTTGNASRTSPSQERNGATSSSTAHT